MTQTTQPQAAPEQETTQTYRRPKWTVMSNLGRKEQTVWIGKSVEFFDDERQADICFQRHRTQGDTPTKRPFHHSDEVYLHIMDTRLQKLKL